MAMTLHTSNRMELLLDHLAEVLDKPAGPVLSREVIVVQSRGMSRWIAMELAKKFGVWAHCAFPFPNKFIMDLFTAAMPEITSSELFNREIVLWRVISQLEQLLDKPEFKELQTYLTGHSRGMRIYQLADKIADTFDQYTLYRGDVLKLWESGAGSDWQAILWQQLAADDTKYHRGRFKTEFLKRLTEGSIDASALPPRVLVFGLSYMPAFHMEILAAIARFVEVHIFVLSPCREYWGDILAKKLQARQGREFTEAAEEGNALLASLGKLGRNFSNLILDCGAQLGLEQDEYAEAAGDSLLSSLQNGILNLVNADPQHKIAIAADDRSIAVHSCHSPMREVEVLHDQLLDLFATMDGLAPRDIIVMTPDIETYSSYIPAVFSGHQDPKRRIPFTIADRSLCNEGSIGKSLMAILTLPGGRFTAPEVIDILSSASVCSCFNLSGNDLELVKNWLEETHITWGMNADDRSASGLPGYAEGSWMAGLERLVFGYALSSDDNVLIDGILPFDNMEGDAAPVLGRFVQCVRALHAAASDLGTPRTLAEWRETLGALQKNFFTPSQAVVREYHAIEKVIDSLGNIGELSSFPHEVGLDVMRLWLRKHLDSEGAGVGFLSGKVTFCAMLPMRSIPVKVVALLGMNDGSFPRQSRSPGFDIIPAEPRPGDRSLRDEDRYLFLEALLSARERLYVSYTGLSIRDNSILPPSVLISELLDFLDCGYTRICTGDPPGGSGEFHTSLMTLHRLQPFSPAYFNGREQGLFSYSAENLRAARGLLAASNVRPRFFSEPLSPPDELFREVRIADIVKFYENPSAAILRHRLGIKPEEKISPLQEREIFELDNLQAYSIKKELLDHVLAGKNVYELRPIIRARGALPPAGRGDTLFDKLATEATEFARQVMQAVDGQHFLPPLDVDLNIGAFRLYGRIAAILPQRLLHYRSSKLAAKDQVKLWLEHLIVNFVADETYPKQSTLIMLNGSVDLLPVADSKTHLERLLQRYWQGLTKPLHFFPRSSLAYAEKGKISAAEAQWNNDNYPECADPAYQLCFGEESPLDGEFEAVSSDVFTAYLDSIKEHP
ncbi:MAG TPA: exodeoxyribonuclease V subunit gamma [Desulfuromonadales bacterium]|nr:exodeoxyribonuclease V subunit gamma [Desulfuromonadales bacterium]